MYTEKQERKKDIIDKIHSMCVSILYDRMLGMSADEANTVCAQHEIEGVVCPPKLVENDVFTTGKVDNIDHSPSPTNSSSSFCGTAISINSILYLEMTSIHVLYH